MSKKIISALGFLALVGLFALPQQSSAQYVVSSGTTSCISISHYLAYGSSDYSTGGDVTKLQNFLTSTGYLVNTVSTGYFGTATYNALIRFQAANGISAIGTVGPLTRSKITSLSCGGYSYISPANPIAPINPFNGYGYNTISLSSISSSYGEIGSTITLYGTGFASTGNIVHFGGGTISNVTSYNGTSLSFQVPTQLSSCTQYSCTNSILYVAAGSYPIYVTNSYGTSNSINFTVTNSGNGYYPYGGNGGYNQPVINGIQTPTSLSVGQVGTWTVSATDPYNGNLTYSVNWGDQYNYAYNTSSNVTSAYSGQTSTFTHSYSTAGTYTVTFTVTDSSGYTAQTSSTVNVGSTYCPYYTSGYNTSNNYNNCNGGGYTSGTPSISTISPTQANIGTTVTIYGSGFTSTGNSVLFGQGAINNISSYDGRTLSFTIPSYLSAYCSGQSGYACPQYAIQLQNGNYGVSVENANGTSNQISFTIGYGNYGTNGINLSSASPSAGPVNTQVTLYGTGFSSSETVHFGSSIIQNVYSNGNSLTFYVPSQQNCTYATSGSYGTNCSTYYQATNNGTYQIYVTDQYGTEQSNSISFNVTGNTSGSTGSVTLTSATSNARVGSVVTVYGTGFDYSNNYVYINGAQVASGISSYNNGYIQFTLPAYAGSQYLSPGSTYSLTVGNSSGYTSNALSFTVGY